jgi:zinc/manganese transport system permease protein
VNSQIMNQQIRFSWNLFRDVAELFSHPFMVHAMAAGAIVAALAGIVGWFVVLRRQSFAAHTLALVGFPGAAGASLLGVATTYGYFTGTILAALAIGLLPRVDPRGRGDESAITGTVQGFVLACGFLFMTLYPGYLSGLNALLFGSFLGISLSQVYVLAGVTVVVLLLLAVGSRPLLFASVDMETAAARGVPVRILSAGFLVLLGAAVAEVSQITGSLLVFALLVMPASAAQRLTARPWLGMLFAAIIGVASTWLALGVAFYTPYPVGFFVTTFAFGIYLLCSLYSLIVGRPSRTTAWASRPGSPTSPASDR